MAAQTRSQQKHEAWRRQRQRGVAAAAVRPRQGQHSRPGKSGLRQEAKAAAQPGGAREPRKRATTTKYKTAADNSLATRSAQLASCTTGNTGNRQQDHYTGTMGSQFHTTANNSAPQRSSGAPHRAAKHPKSTRSAFPLFCLLPRARLLHTWSAGTRTRATGCQSTTTAAHARSENMRHRKKSMNETFEPIEDRRRCTRDPGPELACSNRAEMVSVIDTPHADALNDPRDCTVHQLCRRHQHRTREVCYSRFTSKRMNSTHKTL